MSIDAVSKNIPALKGEKNAPEKGGENLALESAPAATTVPEKKLPGVLGLTREQLLEWRQKTGMAEGAEFVTIGKEVHLTHSGLQRVAALANLPTDALMFLLEARPGPELLVVYRVCVNERILLAHKPEADPLKEGNVFRVVVRSNRNFIPGMPVPAVFEQGDLYRLEHACPRWRGRW